MSSRERVLASNQLIESAETKSIPTRPRFLTRGSYRSEPRTSTGGPLLLDS